VVLQVLAVFFVELLAVTGQGGIDQLALALLVQGLHLVDLHLALQECRLGLAVQGRDQQTHPGWECFRQPLQGLLVIGHLVQGIDDENDRDRHGFQKREGVFGIFGGSRCIRQPFPDGCQKPGPDASAAALAIGTHVVLEDERLGVGLAIRLHPVGQQGGLAIAGSAGHQKG
jgi:hypothetical protein